MNLPNIPERVNHSNNIRINCPCGGYYKSSTKRNHLKTYRHNKFNYNIYKLAGVRCIKMRKAIIHLPYRFFPSDPTLTRAEQYHEDHKEAGDTRNYPISWNIIHKKRIARILKSMKTYKENPSPDDNSFTKELMKKLEKNDIKILTNLDIMHIEEHNHEYALVLLYEEYEAESRLNTNYIE